MCTFFLVVVWLLAGLDSFVEYETEELCDVPWHRSKIILALLIVLFWPFRAFARILERIP